MNIATTKREDSTTLRVNIGIAESVEKSVWKQCGDRGKSGTHKS